MSALEASCIGTSCETIQTEGEKFAQFIRRMNDAREIASIVISEVATDQETATAYTAGLRADADNWRQAQAEQVEDFKEGLVALCPAAAYVVTAEGVELSCPYIGPSDSQD